MKKSDYRYIENRLNERFIQYNIYIKISVKKGLSEENSIITLNINNKKYQIIISNKITSYTTLINIFTDKIREVLASGRIKTDSL